MFLNHIPRMELEQLYCEQDLFIMPSRYESFGYVAAEAIRAEIPTIISSTSTISTHFSNMETGIIFNNENIQDLIEKITFVYNNYSKAVDIVGKSKKILRQKMSPEKLIPKYIEYYNRVFRECTC